MKVLLTTSVDFPVSRTLKHAGTHRVVYALAKELKQMGVTVTICCSGDSDEMGGARHATVERALHSQRHVTNVQTGSFGRESDLSSEIILEGSYTDQDEQHFNITVEYAIAQGVDILHDHGGGLLLSDAFRRKAKNLSMPILTTLHGAVTADDHVKECPTYNELRADNIYFSCVGEHQAQLWRQHLDIDAVIHNGIFVEDYHLRSTKKDYLFSLGRIMRRKGQDVAVEVAERTGLKLVLAGPIMEPDYFDRFRRRVRVIPHIGRIPVTPSYLPEVVETVLATPEPAVYIGQLDDAQKDVWFGHAFCFLMPIRWDEPFGLVLLEAMACGTPVLAFNRGGAPEVIVDGQTGFIVDSADEMVEAVGKVDQIDPAQCRRHVEQHFSSQVMGLKYLKVYEQLLNAA